MKDLEKIYDELISPRMREILSICKQYNLPMFAEFQYSDDGFCKSGLRTGHPVMNHYDAISQSKGDGGVNIDKYMFWVMKLAKDSGHNSLILHQLGISEKP